MKSVYKISSFIIQDDDLMCLNCSVGDEEELLN